MNSEKPEETVIKESEKNDTANHPTPEQRYYGMLRYDHALDAEESRKYFYDPNYSEDSDPGCLNRDY